MKYEGASLLWILNRFSNNNRPITAISRSAMINQLQLFRIEHDHHPQSWDLHIDVCTHLVYKKSFDSYTYTHYHKQYFLPMLPRKLNFFINTYIPTCSSMIKRLPLQYDHFPIQRFDWLDHVRSPSTKAPQGFIFGCDFSNLEVTDGPDGPGWWNQ